MNGRNQTFRPLVRLSISSDRIEDRDIAGILAVTSAELLSCPNYTTPPLGLAVREPNSGSVRFHFHKRRPEARRLEAARFLADNILAANSDNWFPLTDSKTVRQKVQRAFAAEFLCPVQSVIDFLNGDYSSEHLEDAAAHYGVSSYVIERHLTNADLIQAPEFTW